MNAIIAMYGGSLLFCHFHLLYEFRQSFINIFVLFSIYSRHTFIKTGMQLPA